jgi:hypothetical protein
MGEYKMHNDPPPRDFFCTARTVVVSWPIKRGPLTVWRAKGDWKRTIHYRRQGQSSQIEIVSKSARNPLHDFFGEAKPCQAANS